MLLADSVRHLAKLDHSVIVTADDVAALYWSSPLDIWNVEEYPTVAPPFENLWIEFNAPSHFSTDDGEFVWPQTYPRKWGAAILSGECKLHELMGKLCSDGGSPLDTVQQQVDADRTRWSVVMSLFIKFPHIPAFEIAVRTFALDSEGRVIMYQDDRFTYTCFLGCFIEGNQLPETLETGDENLYDATGRYFETVFLAINFMHCRNVVLKNEQPTKLENTLRRTKGKPPLLTYKSLVIDHMKEVLRSEGGMVSGNSLKRAIHICRGHFAHYTEEHPLFGRIVGTFWVPQHVRGTRERGIVNKTYEVQ